MSIHERGEISFSLPALARLGVPLGHSRLHMASEPSPEAAQRPRQMNTKARLESELTLGAAGSLLAEVEGADPRSLPRVGARLYRFEHSGAALAGGQPSQAEWRRIWQAYRARRPARPA